MEKRFKLVPGDWDRTILVELPLVLLPTEVDLFPKEKSYKQNSVWPSTYTHAKVVLTLLAEVITLHVDPYRIDVRGLGLELISRKRLFFFVSLGPENRLVDLVQVLLCKPGNISIGVIRRLW